ncbi:hypothetical protein AFCDBAGC_4905 [Methylobacterium cerastii]|uniref:Uncharacterized protein n=1 Tax=Methylobacterium cerastii TaxID=932741 RepID=A0ABQ4QQD1_9HYPH|nr:hypothetical protein [Methylobacterium cerastii]GJD47020.1 hypothetical protein AFCDBAGC_4905 [Methylobacterium cerastii]
MTAAPEICIAAIDPGLTGAICFFFPALSDRVSVEDMPVVNGEVDVSILARRIRQLAPTFIVVEQVGPMPRDGCRQAFGLGTAYAAAKATVTLCTVPLHLVTPQVWKRHHRLIGADDPKEAGRALALRLFPASAEHFARKKDHNRSDAALIAAYAAAAITSGRAE